MFKKPTNKRELIESLRTAEFHVLNVHEGYPSIVGDTIKKLPWREVTVIVLRDK